MRVKLSLVTALLVSLCLPAFAHRLDEYLQATMVSVEKDRIQVSLRLVPGVAVLPAVLASIDTNRDEVISQEEGHAYAQQVVNDLSVSLDGQPMQPKLVSANFPSIDEMRQGLGEIHIELSAAMKESELSRTLVIRNDHQSRMAAYLVNCLSPQDHSIRILRQSRNRNQSFYQLDFRQEDNTSAAATAPWWSTFGGFGSMFRLGMRHIAEGTDHLLFLLALLLPAPLLAVRSQWAGFANLRHSVAQILKVVTAFTVGHSITLALAGLGFVAVPSRPIEVLIAVSIVVSSLHALRPIFPGREPVIAGCFGLIHGLAFAASLSHLGLGRWVQLANIFAFNAGIESMQLLVIAATMPSLVLLSRTRAYSFVRITGGLFAGLASAGWVAERLLGLHTSVDIVVNEIAHHAAWIAGTLFLASAACWSLRRNSDERIEARDPLSAPRLESSV